MTTRFSTATCSSAIYSVSRYYRARGYYQAKVRAGRVFYRSARQTSVQILVEEGPPTIVRRIDLHGLNGLPAPLLAHAEMAVRSSVGVGKRFEEAAFAGTEVALRALLSAAGYAFVRTRRSADVDLSNGSVAVGFWVEPGPIAHIGEMRILGLVSIPERLVRRAVTPASGDPYSSGDLASAEQALLKLGIFGSASVKPDLGENFVPTQGAVVPTVVRVEPSKLRSVRLGAGAAVDAQRSEVNLEAGWDSFNSLRGLRRFATELAPGVVLYPTHIPTFEAPQRLLPQISRRSELREPGFLEPRTRAVVSAQCSPYPLNSIPTVDAELKRARASLEVSENTLRLQLASAVIRARGLRYDSSPNAELGGALVLSVVAAPPGGSGNGGHSRARSPSVQGWHKGRLLEATSTRDSVGPSSGPRRRSTLCASSRRASRA